MTSKERGIFKTLYGNSLYLEYSIEIKFTKQYCCTFDTCIVSLPVAENGPGFHMEQQEEKFPKTGGGGRRDPNSGKRGPGNGT